MNGVSWWLEDSRQAYWQDRFIPYIKSYPLFSSQRKRISAWRSCDSSLWVAGEDHDVDEINFVYTSGEKVQSSKSCHYITSKNCCQKNTSASRKTEKWLRDVFSTYEESAYTNDLLNQLLRCLRKSQTFTDFFEWIVCDLLKKMDCFYLIQET